MGDLRKVPGISAKRERDLAALGIFTLSDLKDADPEDLFLRDSFMRGRKRDSCTLYIFRCAVAYANDPHPNPDKYRWWYFSDHAKI